MKSLAELGHLLGAGTPGVTDKTSSSDGLVDCHAYGLLRVEEVDDSAGVHQLVQLRNPWGRQEWTGTFSDSDAASWSRRVCAKLQYDPKGKSKAAADDGIFWMLFSDFVVHFEQLYICHIIATRPAGRWYRYTAAGEWRGRSAGGCSNNPRTVNGNPQFALPVRVAANVILRLESDVDDCTAVEVYAARGARVRDLARDEPLLKGSPNNYSWLVPVEGALPAAATPYTIAVSTFKPGVEAAFVLSVYVDVLLDGLPDGAALTAL